MKAIDSVLHECLERIDLDVKAFCIHTCKAKSSTKTEKQRYSLAPPVLRRVQISPTDPINEINWHRNFVINWGTVCTRSTRYQVVFMT